MTLVNMGIALEIYGQMDQSIKYYKKAIQIDPQYAIAYVNLGNSLLLQGKLLDAEVSYKLSLQRDPTQPSFYSKLLFLLNHNPQYTAQYIFQEHVGFARQFADRIRPKAFSGNKKITKQKLKIGYVSPDFRGHSVAYFIEPVIASHNREHFEIFCYSNSLIQDDTTRRIQAYSDHWRTIYGIPDEKAADLICADGIDILVDLAGHTVENRILLFARKPAPISITWIEYPSTTGLSTID